LILTQNFYIMPFLHNPEKNRPLNMPTDTNRYTSDGKTPAELLQDISNLSPQITYLDFSKVFLIPDIEPHLPTVIAKVPNTVTHFNFGHNAILGFMPKEIQEKSFKLLPKFITHLYLTHCFSNMGSTMLGRFKAAIPDNITHLYLRGNDLFGFPLPELFQHLPVNLNSLDLGENGSLAKYNFPRQQGELITLFHGLPPKVQRLGLSNNNINELKPETLDSLLYNLPPQITYLDLSNNKLWAAYPNSHQPTEIKLSPSITDLDLSDNDCDMLPLQKLISLLQSLPKTLKTVRLGENNRPSQRPQAEQEALRIAVPELTLIGNGPSEAILSLVPMHQMASSVGMPLEVANLITDYLAHPEETVSLRQAWKEEIYPAFDAQMQILALKAKQFNEDKHESAEKEVYALMGKLNDTMNQSKTFAAFKSQTQSILADAHHSELAEHRGCKEILLNLALCLLGLGVFYLAAVAYRGCFFKANTDTIDKLNALDNQLFQVTPGCA